jgi:phage protein U
MSLATLGPANGDAVITFEVSSDKVLTWHEGERSGEARWAKLDVHGAKPVKEFLGPGLDSISLLVRLDVALGVSPKDELRNMRKQRDEGNVLQFSIGGQLVGDYTLEAINEEWTRFAAGVLQVAIAKIRLEEYA